MKRHILPACLILAATLGTLSLPSAQAGGAINKCVDGAGRVTLTDQPCDANTVSSSISVPGTLSDDGAVPDNAALSNTRTSVPRQLRRTSAAYPAAPAHAPLAVDMATMKQARVQMMLQDAAPRNRLALLDK
jgi:hypothetical protein